MLSVIDSQYALSAVLSLHIAILLRCSLVPMNGSCTACTKARSVSPQTYRDVPPLRRLGADNNAPRYAGHYSVRESPSVSLARRVRSPAQPSVGTLRR